MKITQAISSTLLVAITEAIQGSVFTDFGFLELPPNWASTTLNALDVEFAKSLAKSLDGSSLESFVRDQLNLIRIDSGNKIPEKGGRLTDLKSFNEPLNVARNVVSALEQIPTQYRLIVRISQELGERIATDSVNFPLSNRLRIVSGAEIPSTFSVKHHKSQVDSHIRRYLNKDESFEIVREALYIEYRTSGYLAARRQSRAISEFYDEIRAFYGACLTTGILGEFPNWGDPITPILSGTSIIEDTENFAYIERAEDDVVDCANLSTSGETDVLIKDGNGIPDILKPILPVFLSDNSAKLKTASSWALRAHLSKRELDKILESAITIEVLMGDRDTSDRIGLTKLIANRCAYALGKSNKERLDIVDFFVKFYRVRSEVVHSGRTALDPEERKIVNAGLDLATRILRHEISLAR